MWDSKNKDWVTGELMTIDHRLTVSLDEAYVGLKARDIIYLAYRKRVGGNTLKNLTVNKGSRMLNQHTKFKSKPHSLAREHA